MGTSQLLNRFTAGSFVWTHDHYGIGQIATADTDFCSIKLFKSINDEVEALYHTANLRPAYLSPQTRAYYRDQNGIWSVGRIIDYVLENQTLWYVVQFPNRRQQRIREGDIRVRCLQPIDDPAAVLGAGGMESQFLHDRRRAAIETLTSARSNAFGLTALLSASVELAHHQVDVVRRVLNDPIQRYLLADEVGLGKTIEACAIVKQALYDNPDERIVIVVPETLMGQWKRELTWRFFLEPDEYQLRVIPREAICSIDPAEVDTLVVDEAQGLISDHPADSRAYEALRQISLKAHRLLLISATPVLGNEKTLLALLHLLDPLAYPLKDEEAFRKKLERRQEFGRLLLAIKPDQNPVFLARSLRQLQELVPEDELVPHLIAKIEQLLNDQDKPSIFSSVAELHRHISDTYRLHQRLIRTRRRDLLDQMSLSRVALAATLTEDEDERSPQMVDALEQWRQLSLEALATKPDGLAEDFEQELIQRYLKLHEALGTSVEACEEVLESQLHAIDTGHILSFPEDKQALEHALGIINEPTEFTRLDFATDVIDEALKKISTIDRLPRLVAFASSTAFVQDLVAQLRMKRVADAFSVTADSTDEDAIEAVDGFFACPGPAVICCDHRGEEGLNLQYAHGIVHLDLPLVPTRIEQRIGRLDRFGRGVLQDRSILHWVLSPFADYFHPWEAWFNLLKDDFCIFEQSISEVQFLLDELQQSAAKVLYRNGAEGIRSLANQIRDSIHQERERLDEQYALDSRSLMSFGDQDTFTAITSHDTFDHYRPLHLWLTQVLQFDDEWLDDFPGAKVFRLHWTSSTLLPKEPWQELFAADILSSPMTYERQAAAYRRRLRLVRPGLELVDNLENMLRWDDRGTAYATWRLEPEWPGVIRGPWLGFHAVFVVEANMEAATEALIAASQSGESPISFPGVKRRLDSLLPPWTSELYLDIHMEPVTDCSMLQVLRRPYTDRYDELGRRDFNLGNRREILYETIGFEELSFACNRVRQEAETQLLASSEFKSLVTGTAQRALTELEVNQNKLERRRRAILQESGHSPADLDVDIRANSAMAAGISSPVVRLDSIGLIVVSDNFPREDEQK